VTLAEQTDVNMDRINAAIAQAVALCPRSALRAWGRRWMSGDDRSPESLAPIAAAIGIVNVRSSAFARELREAGGRALGSDEFQDWATKGAVLAALEWTRSDPRRGNHHENLAGRIASLASSMGERWTASLAAHRLMAAPRLPRRGRPST